MQRIRIFNIDADGYRYKKTIFLRDASIVETGEALVRDHEVVVGDLIYVGDFYLRLDKTEEGVLRWTQVPAYSPETRGLYEQVVEAEKPVGDPWN